MAHLSWQLGDVRITRIQEIEESGLEWVVSQASPENLRTIPWLAPHFVDDDWEARLSIHALVVETPQQRIVVDTCVGNGKDLRIIKQWHMREGPFLEDLEGAGFARDSIDTVLCTHLHVDHVGWNTIREGDRWVPTFPNADYLIAADEWNHWQGEDEGFNATVLAESVHPIFDADLAKLVPSTHRVCDEVWLEPTPGHTPGHVSIRIASRGEEAVITGDMIHHPCQIAQPGWGSQADSDFDQGVRTREAFLERYADGPVLVIGTHFAGPSAGRIVRDGKVFRLDT